ncbi:MAG: ribonuclease J [Chloroflexi bacterium]|nr:ribonuclease J [Chloroflexota bacterium]
MAHNTLRVIPLGGLGEFGRNMLVFEYGDRLAGDTRLIVIDVGLMFPNNDMLGIDIVIPDMSYVLERIDRLQGIIITHGHEDHVGALPYLLQQTDAPVYATRLTRGLIEVKLREAGIRDADLRLIRPGDKLEISPFLLEFFGVSHSIPDGVGLGINTPVGLVVHSGDFKFDHSPVDGRRTDFAKLAELGGRGVLLLLSDSTNAEKPGYTPSEQCIGEMFADVFANAKGRVIVATFASNISRIQQVLDTSVRYGRRVAIVGRSMTNNVRIARELGYLSVPDDALLTLDQLPLYPDHEITLVCTGSQGEPTSALVRMGERDFRSIQVVPGDTVIVSATPIPGNEELVNRTLDNLFRLGANVFYEALLDVHVSGHASQEEQKMLINLLRPRFFVPIHGEYRHLVMHAKLAQQCGVAPERIFVMETGDVLEVGEDQAAVVDHVADTRVFVDGHGVGDVEQSVIEERRSLSRNGFLLATVTVDKYTGSLIGRPQIVTRGFISETESNGLLAEVEDEVAAALALGGGRAELQERLEKVLSRLAYERTGRRPMTVAVVHRV